jgi:hypothetical protein
MFPTEVRRMKTAKQEVLDLLGKLPDDASLDDIQYHIYVCQKIQKGLEAAERGEVISQAEAERRMARWLEK